MRLADSPEMRHIRNVHLGIAAPEDDREVLVVNDREAGDNRKPETVASGAAGDASPSIVPTIPGADDAVSGVPTFVEEGQWTRGEEETETEILPEDDEREDDTREANIPAFVEEEEDKEVEEVEVEGAVGGEVATNKADDEDVSHLTVFTSVSMISYQCIKI